MTRVRTRYTHHSATADSTPQRPADPSRRGVARPLTAGIALCAATLLLGACAFESTSSSSTGTGTATPTDTTAPTGTVTVVTHDSWNVDEDVLAAFEAETGITVRFTEASGSLANQLILTKDAPLGDVAYGIERASITRAINEGVFDPYVPANLPDSARDYLPDDAGSAVPIDFGDVCVNADIAWFEDRDLEIPSTLDDLIDPAYEDLLVITHPGTSSSGLSFLIATVGAYGDDYLDFWTALKDNGVRVADGWSTAYYSDFSGSDGEGPYPLVLSYSSSPAYTVPEDAEESTTVNLNGTCFREVEYAGVLANAANPEAARVVVDWLLSDEFQEQIPDQMYMYPISDRVEVPSWLNDFGPASPETFDVPAEEIEQNRETWIAEWVELFSS